MLFAVTGVLFRFQQLRQRKAGQSQRTNLQYITAGNPIAEFVMSWMAGQNRKHNEDVRGRVEGLRPQLTRETAGNPDSSAIPCLSPDIGMRLCSSGRFVPRI